MQATITYLLTEQAQRAQMAATGQPVARKQVVTVEVPSEDLELMEVRADGTPYLDLAPGGMYDEPAPIHTTHIHCPHLRELRAAGCAGLGTKYKRYATGSEYNLDVPGIPDANADILALIKAGRVKIAADDAAAKRESAREAEEKRTRAVQCDPLVAAAIDALPDDTSDWNIVSEEARKFQVYNGEIIVRELMPLSFAARDRLSARIKLAADAKKAADAAREQAKIDFIASWISAYADDATRDQFADGLLCRATTLSLIADAAFDAAGVPVKAKVNTDFCDASSCPCGQKTLDCLPLSVYPAWRQLKAALPDGYTVEFSRVRECLRGEDEGCYDAPTAGPAIYLAEISIPHGPFTFTRTVRLG